MRKQINRIQIIFVLGLCLFTPIFLMGETGGKLPPTGLLPPSEEDQAWLKENSRFLPPPSEKELSELPARHINLEHLPPVGRQLLGSCASWAIVYYMKGWHKAKEHGITRPFPEDYILSPAFAFRYVGIGARSGSSFEGNVEFLQRHGTTTLEEYPESRTLFEGDSPSLDLWRSAASRRAAPGSFASIETNTQAGLDTLKAHLVGGELAATGVGVYSNFDNYPANGQGVNNGVFFAEGTSGYRDNHALTIIGYDDNISYFNGTEQRQGAFLAVNSWGTTWGVAAEEGGERGYVWLAYEYFLNNRGAIRWFNFYTYGNLAGHDPKHFVILDIKHPRRVEINVSFHAGSNPPDTAKTIFVKRGVNPIDERLAIDVTELAHQDDEGFWLGIFDIVLPEFGQREPAVIREFTVEQPGRHPITAVNNIPFHPINQLEQTIPRTEWISASPVYQHAEMFPPDGLLHSEGGVVVSADIGDIFGEGTLDVVSFGELLRFDGNRPVSVRRTPLGEVALGDYDNDGLVDLAVRDRSSGQLHLYRNRGDGVFSEETFLPPSSSQSSSTPHWVDFNGNGRLDLMTISVNDTKLYLNMGGGVFRESGMTFPTAPFYLNMIVDFDQDGLMDFGGWRNLGNGEWAAPPWRDTQPIAWGDYNGNGLLDVAVMNRNNTITIYRNEGEGSFVEAQRDIPAFYWNDARMRWGDVNNSGRLDLIAKGNLESGMYISTESRTQVYSQLTNGSFLPTGIDIHRNGQGGILLVADFDQDGDLDFLTGGYPSVIGTAFQSSVPRIVQYTEGLYANDPGRNLPNAPPSPPTNLRAEQGNDPGEVTLTWDDATDDRTPPRGLRYQIRVGTSPGGHQIVSAAHSLAEFPQRRLSPEQAGMRLNSLEGRTHYWSIRTVDASGAFSPWTAEHTFNVERGVRALPPIDPNQDGMLDAGDVATVRSLIGHTHPDQLFRADIDGTGSITSNDVAEIARMLVRPGTGPTPPWIAMVDSNGAELKRDDATVVIPPDAIVGEAVPMRLGRGTSTRFEQTGNFYHTYRLSGIPTTLAKPIQVSVYNPDWWRPGWEDPLLAVMEEGFFTSKGSTGLTSVVIEPESNVSQRLTFTIHPLEDEVLKLLDKDFVEGTYSTDFFVLAGYSIYTTPNFRVAFPRSFNTEIVENLANDLEQAHARYRQSGMGFSYAARTRWPLSVTLKDLGVSTYGQAYSSLRGVNHGGLEFNTRFMSDPQTRRVTAFHEFFHIVEAFYDPRNRYSQAKLIAPHYTLSEMAATWIEELAVSNPQGYVPAEWETNRFALFEMTGMDLPPSTANSTRNAGIVAAHGYGLAPLIRYLVRRHDTGIVSRIYQNIRAGQNWVSAVGNASGDPHYFWFHSFMVSYCLGEIYPLTPADMFGAAFGKRLRLNPTTTAATFKQKMPNLSASLHFVTLDAQAPAGFLKPEHRLGFRLEGPLRSRLAILSMVGDQSRELVEYVPWDDGISRYLTDSVMPVLSEQHSAYFALVTHDQASPRHADPEEFTLSMALLEDQTIDLPPTNFPGHPHLGQGFPAMQSSGATVFVPAASKILVTPMGDLPAHILTGSIWEDPDAEFEVSVNMEITETTRELTDYILSTSGIQYYELTIHERRGPNPEDLIVVDKFTSTDGTFRVPAHFYEGKCEWIATAHYTTTVTTIATNQSSDLQQWVPLVIFVGDEL